jgi:hypothetical protein
MSHKHLSKSILAISAVAIAAHTEPHVHDLEPPMAPREHIEIEMAVDAVRSPAAAVEQRGNAISVALTGQELQVASGPLGVTDVVSR